MALGHAERGQSGFGEGGVGNPEREEDKTGAVEWEGRVQDTGVLPAATL